jgi:tetratricopeptide (TPR) repeat protein
MRRQPEPFAVAVRAFKEMTAVPDDAAATRARVLAAADRGARTHGTPRRIAGPTVIAILVICSASVAGTTLAQRWRRPAAVAIDETPLSGAAFGSSSHTVRPAVVIPPVVPALYDAPGSGPSDAEADAYGRAHRAHFDQRAPERALAAWDDYLRLYPRGAFAPEARFNRAICLVRLRRFAQAERALRPFADGRLDGYRRAEAEQLLAWLRDRPPTP